MASSGDDGVHDNGDAPNAATSSVRTVDWPGSDPNVTAVGGTLVTLDDQGGRLRPDVVWNDNGAASGGGVSGVFTRPAFQHGVAPVTGAGRGLPDISLTASEDMSTVIRFTDDVRAAWVGIGGTSLAAPLFAGFVALADQQAGGRLGNVNTRLYALARTPEEARKAGIVDITSGVNGQDGYRAAPGYDLASGLGTVDASALVPALAARTG
ncbi:S8 family serine peptidase [Streptomyces sp. R44]|uniref:S8 family serine peptidase n=1 Tax=Streptomyces sp. R44 TaxID=3238633 RepID=A0AB39SR15_9ACTN